MKDLILLVGICVVIVGAAWFLLPGSPPRLFTAPVSQHPSDNAAARAPQTDSKETSAKAKKPNQEHRSSQEAASATPVQTASAPSPIAPVPSAQYWSRVPESHEIRIGTDGVDVLNRFGAPMASAYTVDRGHYFETYFYRGEHTQATVHLRDGKVYSVYAR